MLWYSLEVPYWCTSNEYHQRILLWSEKKKYQYFSAKKKEKKTYLIQSYVVAWLICVLCC